MAEKRLSEGQVIAGALETLYGNGTVLKKGMNLLGLGGDVFRKYILCKERLRSGEYTEKDLEFAQQLIDTGKIGIKYNIFDLEATRMESEYLRKCLEEK